MNFLEIAQTRYTSKAYDKTQKIPNSLLEQLLEILRLTPSSVNIQPWQFIIVQTETAKQKIIQATQGNFAYNTPKLLNASAVIIFAAKNDISEQHLDDILQCEDRAGRFRSAESKQAQHDSRLGYINLYKSQNVLDSWVDQQIHIALGGLLFAAASYRIDATPMGGFDNQALDKALDLKSQNLRSVVIACLGYHSYEDFNAQLVKARLPHNQVIRFM